MRYVLLLALAMCPSDIGKSCWRVETQVGSASGVVLENGRLLTAYHVAPDPELKVYALSDKGSLSEENEVQIAKMSKDKDLLLLRGVHIRGRKLTIANVELGEEVHTINYGMDMRGYVRGRVMRIDNGQLYIDILCLRGSSGGGLFNSKGELVGLIHGFYTDGYSVICYASSAETLREFLR